MGKPSKPQLRRKMLFGTICSCALARWSRSSCGCSRGSRGRIGNENCRPTIQGRIIVGLSSANLAGVSLKTPPTNLPIAAPELSSASVAPAPHEQLCDHIVRRGKFSRFDHLAALEEEQAMPSHWSHN